jgi:hypothetical protein
MTRERTHQPSVILGVSVKHRIHLRSREVIEFVFHSASAILEIDGSEVSDGEIEILPPPRSPGSPPLPGRGRIRAREES